MSRCSANLDLIGGLVLAAVAAVILTRPRRVPATTRLSVLLSTSRQTQQEVRRPSRPMWRRPVASAATAQSAGRRLSCSAAMLAFSVLADSAVEHYRGSFQNWAMYIPLIASAVTVGGGSFGTMDRRPARHPVRDTIYGAAAATGFAGLAFHTYNILKRPGRLSWLNLFYGAPIGAPLALALAGFLGRGAERVRTPPQRQRPTLIGLPAGRCLAAVSAAGLAGTVAEAGLLHYRGAFQNPFMVAPVTVPPLASLLLFTAALSPRPAINQFTRLWLWFTAFLGFAGVGFHAYGISRNMGGWRSWTQNLLNGPPLPAPPSFTGLALAGLAALSLIEEELDG